MCPGMARLAWNAGGGARWQGGAVRSGHSRGSCHGAARCASRWRLVLVGVPSAPSGACACLLPMLPSRPGRAPHTLLAAGCAPAAASSSLASWTGSDASGSMTMSLPAFSNHYGSSTKGGGQACCSWHGRPLKIAAADAAAVGGRSDAEALLKHLSISRASRSNSRPGMGQALGSLTASFDAATVLSDNATELPAF